jgi:hypothetical protein
MSSEREHRCSSYAVISDAMSLIDSLKKSLYYFVVVLYSRLTDQRGDVRLASLALTPVEASVPLSSPTSTRVLVKRSNEPPTTVMIYLTNIIHC